MSGILIPDLGATFDRAEQARTSRLQALMMQRQADEEARFAAAMPEIAAGLGNADPNVRNAAVTRLGSFRQGFGAALPLIQQERGARDLAEALGGGQAAPAAPMPGVRAEPLPPPQGNDANGLDLVARVLYGEAGGEGEEGLRAAAHVINNRARLTGMTPAQVVMQRGQFEAFGNPETRARLMQLPPERLARARAIAERVFGGNDQDLTQGATHFLNPALQASLGRQQPEWAPEGQGTRIGNHVFYSRPGDFRRAPNGDVVPVSQQPQQPAAPAGVGRGGQLPGGELGRILSDPEAYGRVARLAAAGNEGAARLLQAAQPFLAQRGEGEPLERVLGPNGQPVLVPRSRAAGMTPAPTSPQVAIDQRGEGAFSQRIGTVAADELAARRTSASNAVRSLETFQVVADLLNDGVITGTLAEFRTNAERLLATAGLIDGQRVTRTEGVIQALAQGTLEAAGGLSGPTSDRDIIFLRDVAAGRIDFTEATIRRAVETGARVSARAINSYNQAAQALQQDASAPAMAREIFRPIPMPSITLRPRSGPPPPGEDAVGTRPPLGSFMR